MRNESGRSWRVTLRGWLALVLCALLLRAVAPAAPVQEDHIVGTLARVDAGQSRLALSKDSETGNVVGQGTQENVYLAPTTAITRSGKPVKLSDLQPGERLLVATRVAGNRTQAVRVRVLPSTLPGSGWGRYLHGTLRSIERASRSVHIDQADTLNFVRIDYDDQTRAFDADGKPIALTSLKPGDELDLALRLDGNNRTAIKVVRLPPHGGR